VLADRTESRVRFIDRALVVVLLAVVWGDLSYWDIDDRSLLIIVPVLDDPVLRVASYVVSPLSDAKTRHPIPETTKLTDR
jgi:hypothetical protein